MLTDSERELLAAAVDGSLPPDREEAFRALLALNPAAVTLFTRLKSDSRRLRDLPRHPAPVGLAFAVARKVEALPKATPVATRNLPTELSTRAGWVAYAVAASVLFAAAGISFWISVREDADATRRIVHKQQSPRPLDPDTGDVKVHTDPIVPDPKLLSAPQHAARPYTGESELAVNPRPAVTTPERAPFPRPTAGEVVGSRPESAPKPFESVQARVPVLAPVAELDRDEVRALILHELGQDPAFRLDLFARDVPRAASLLRAAGQAAGVRITVEASAQERIRKKVPTILAVYTEALSAEDITRLLTRLASRTRAAEKDGPVFTTAHLVPAQAADQRDLRELLGVDPGLWKAPPAGDSPKSITAGTAGELAAALDKDKDKDLQPAIMLTYMPVPFRVNPAASNEVKSFLDSRSERKPDAVPLLVVIRPAP
jgi:hypothetical protein